MKPSLRIICETRAHCPACREKGLAGDAFRASLAACYGMPPDWPACPYGVPIGATVPPAVFRLWRGGGDVLEWVLSTTGAARLYKKLRRGRPCGCGERKHWLNRVLRFWWRPGAGGE